MLKKIKRFGLRTLRKMRFLPPKFYARVLYEYHTGKKLNLENPKEFNEKIQWYKVFYHPSILTQLVDKYAVRQYVEEKIGAQYLNEIYGVYEKADDIPFNKLPNKFAIKATHTSSHNLIVSNKKTLNIPKAIKQINKWLGINQYYRMGQEWAYKDVQPRIVIEKFLTNEGQNSLIDYKFFCFNGTPKFVEIHIDRETDHKQSIYDLDFKLLPFGRGSKEKSISCEIEKPVNFDEMVSLAKKLSENFPFVRVDLYSIEGKTIFGEMTFYPADGCRREFYPDEYNEIIGNYFELPKLTNGNPITEFTIT